MSQVQTLYVCNTFQLTQLDLPLTARTFTGLQGRRWINDRHLHPGLVNCGRKQAGLMLIGILLLCTPRYEHCIAAGCMSAIVTARTDCCTDAA